MDRNFTELKEGMERLYESFNKLPDDMRKKEFAEYVCSNIVVRQVVDIIKKTDKKVFTEAFERYDFIGELLTIVGTFMDAGLDFGWCVKEKGDENGK